MPVFGSFDLPNSWNGTRLERSLPLPLGEVAERSEDGEGKHAVRSQMDFIMQEGCKALSVTCGDSSPKGRAKGLYPLHSLLA